MGWTYLSECRTRAALTSKLLSEVTDTGRRAILAHGESPCPTGTHKGILWVAVRDTHTAREFIGCFLLDRDQSGWWGYKAMDETCNPFYYNVPDNVLAAAPTDPEMGYSTRWRAEVEAYRRANYRRQVSEITRVGAERNAQQWLDYGGAYDGFRVTSDADPGL